MIRTVNRIRIDDTVTPLSFELADKACGIAYHFEQDPEDILQELMHRAGVDLQ